MKTTNIYTDAKSPYRDMIEANQAAKNKAWDLIARCADLGPFGRLPNWSEWLELACENPHEAGSPAWANWLSGISQSSSSSYASLSKPGSASSAISKPATMVAAIARLTEISQQLAVPIMACLASYLGRCRCLSASPGMPCKTCEVLAEDEGKQGIFIF